jgi:peptidyl-tRNA hydrolase
MEPEIKYKQFVIIPKVPHMSAGKIASQTAHATFMVLEKQKNKAIIKEWKKSGMCVIVLETKSPLQLFGISKYLDEWHIAHHLYIDEGLTEVSMGTPTALATEVLGLEWHWIFKTMELLK